MNNIIISNTCVGQGIINKKNILPYNNPFIGSLIPNDKDYIKLVNNFHIYIELIPIINIPRSDSIFAIQNKNIYYLHKDIKTPYPIIYLGDIEIHFIHENNADECLNKFNKRLNRLKYIIKNENYKIIFTLSLSEFVNNHDDISLLIDEYFIENNNNNLVIEKYFIGCENYYKSSYPNYIKNEKWNNVILQRDTSHIYVFNDQKYLVDMFNQYIKYL
jgi:uncharacterized protein (DUF1919 family)